jgi:hypothetical protein
LSEGPEIGSLKNEEIALDDFAVAHAVTAELIPIQETIILPTGDTITGTGTDNTDINGNFSGFVDLSAPMAVGLAPIAQRKLKTWIVKAKWISQHFRDRVPRPLGVRGSINMFLDGGTATALDGGDSPVGQVTASFEITDELVKINTDLSNAGLMMPIPPSPSTVTSTELITSTGPGIARGEGTFSNCSITGRYTVDYTYIDAPTFELPPMLITSIGQVIDGHPFQRFEYSGKATMKNTLPAPTKH